MSRKNFEQFLNKNNILKPDNISVNTSIDVTLNTIGKICHYYQATDHMRNSICQSQINYFRQLFKSKQSQTKEIWEFYQTIEKFKLNHTEIKLFYNILNFKDQLNTIQSEIPKTQCILRQNSLIYFHGSELEKLTKNKSMDFSLNNNQINKTNILRLYMIYEGQLRHNTPKDCLKKLKEFVGKQKSQLSLSDFLAQVIFLVYDDQLGETNMIAITKSLASLKGMNANIANSISSKLGLNSQRTLNKNNSKTSINSTNTSMSISRNAQSPFSSPQTSTRIQNKPNGNINIKSSFTMNERNERNSRDVSVESNVSLKSIKANRSFVSLKRDHSKSSVHTQDSKEKEVGKWPAMERNKKKKTFDLNFDEDNSNNGHLDASVDRSLSESQNLMPIDSKNSFKSNSTNESGYRCQFKKSNVAIQNISSFNYYHNDTIDKSIQFSSPISNIDQFVQYETPGHCIHVQSIQTDNYQSVQTKKTFDYEQLFESVQLDIENVQKANEREIINRFVELQDKYYSWADSQMTKDKEFKNAIINFIHELDSQDAFPLKQYIVDRLTFCVKKFHFLALGVMKECNSIIYSVYKILTKELNENDNLRNLLDFQNGEIVRNLWRTHKKSVQTLSEFNLDESIQELQTQFNQNEPKDEIEQRQSDTIPVSEEPKPPRRDSNEIDTPKLNSLRESLEQLEQSHTPMHVDLTEKLNAISEESSEDKSNEKMHLLNFGSNEQVRISFDREDDIFKQMSVDQLDTPENTHKHDTEGDANKDTAQSSKLNNIDNIVINLQDDHFYDENLESTGKDTNQESSQDKDQLNYNENEPFNISQEDQFSIIDQNHTGDHQTNILYNNDECIEINNNHKLNKNYGTNSRAYNDDGEEEKQQLKQMNLSDAFEDLQDSSLSNVINESVADQKEVRFGKEDDLANQLSNDLEGPELNDSNEISNSIIEKLVKVNGDY